MRKKNIEKKEFVVPKNAKLKEDIIRPLQIISPKHNAIIAFIVFAFVMIVYQMTNSPSLAFWDSGEYTTAAKLFSVLHAPGNPTYIIFGRFLNILGLGMSTPQVISFLSSLWGALAVMFTYLYTIKIVSMFEKRANVAVPIGIIAALLTAFSYTFWTNSVEPEVYSGLAFFINFIIYLLLVWLQKSEDLSHQNYLIFIIYLFFLGFGLHQTVLQIVPAVLLIAVYPLIKPYFKKDSFYTKLVIWIISLFIFYFVINSHFPKVSQPLFALAIIAVLMYYLRGRVSSTAWILALIVIIIGFSTHLYIPIRASFNPFINEGDPQNWERFMAFFNREQFGKTDIFDRNAGFFSGQLGYHFLRYFNWQYFNTQMLSKISLISKETLDFIFIAITYLLGLLGIVFQLKKNKTSFVYLFSLFFMGSVAMVFVMNIPVDTPRPRDYFFVTAYNLWATFMAIGIIYGLKKIFTSKKLYPLVIIIAFIFPTLTLVSQYHYVDRSKEFYAAEYGMNFLNSLEENAIIFTNGDNDTFPLWYAQAVDDPYILANQPHFIPVATGVKPDSLTKAQIAKAMDFKNRECHGIRKDVSVANYSLMNTPWYIRQLRDREGINISLHDSQIEELVTPQRFVEPLYRVTNRIAVPRDSLPYGEWRTRRIVNRYELPLGHWRKDDNLSMNVIKDFDLKQSHLVNSSNPYGILRGQDKAAMQIIKDNLGERPIYFATTVGGQFLGLDDYLEDHVMVYKLNPDPISRRKFSPLDKYAEFLENVYTVESIMDSSIYKDEVVARLTVPYVGHYSRLAETYLRDNKPEDAIRNYEKAANIYNSVKETVSYDVKTYGVSLKVNLATAYTFAAENNLRNNNNENAVENYQDAIKVLISLSELPQNQIGQYKQAIYLGLADAYMGLADIFNTQNLSKQAIDYYQEARLIYESFGVNAPDDIKKDLIYSYIGLAENYAKTNNKDDAIMLYEKAAHLHKYLKDSSSSHVIQIGNVIKQNLNKLRQ